MPQMTLPAGTLVYHGTDSTDFDECDDDLEGPGWVSQARSVAARFAQRGRQPSARVVVFRLLEAVTLPRIDSPRAMQAFAEEHDLQLNGVEEIRDSVERAGLPGWILPSNYPDGDDILLVDTRVLEYVETLSA